MGCTMQCGSSFINICISCSLNFVCMTQVCQSKTVKENIVEQQQMNSYGSLGDKGVCHITDPPKNADKCGPGREISYNDTCATSLLTDNNKLPLRGQI